MDDDNDNDYDYGDDEDDDDDIGDIFTTVTLSIIESIY